MAAKRTTKKPAPIAKKKPPNISRLTLKQRLVLIVVVIVLFLVGVVAFLHFTGIMTAEDILIKYGLMDRPATRADLEVHFIDVGQGDCTLIASQGKVMLIDCGERDESNKVEQYLIRHGIQHIDYIVATHPHSDHIGEMSDIIRIFDVDKCIMPSIPEKHIPTTKCYEDMLRELEAKNVETFFADTDSKYQFGCCEIGIYYPDVNDTENLNDYSLIVRVVHGKNSFLVTGDCEVSEERSLLAQKKDLSAKVLKVGHHGSSTSSSAEFLDKVKPEYAVISCGRDNDYGHPADDTVRRISKYAGRVYLTPRDGDIVFISDGEGLSVECSGDK